LCTGICVGRYGGSDGAGVRWLMLRHREHASP
jgi:hypothetical protein